jgi:ribosomal protein S18 acetylase RimI-like enzyme
MPIAYRTLLPSEEDMLFDLRSQVLDTPREICTQLFTDFGTDAQCHDHTLVAVDETGAVIATAGYWLRMIRGIDGRPQRTGHLYGVATRPDKRGQHHAGRLLSLAIEKMQQDGCVWSVLGAREAARPLYERNGWKSYASPFRSVITAIDPSKGAAAYTTEQISPDQLDSRWEDIAAIYSAFNWERPLTLLRTEAYWKGYVGWMLRDWMEHYQARLFLASHAERTLRLRGCPYLRPRLCPEVVWQPALVFRGRTRSDPASG